MLRAARSLPYIIACLAGLRTKILLFAGQKSGNPRAGPGALWPAAAIIPRGRQLAQTFAKLFEKIEFEETGENESKKENKGV